MPTIDVDLSTHGALRSGITALGTVRVILADDVVSTPADAELLAARIAMESRPGTMATRITTCI